MTHPTDDSLKPCPFCGSQPEPAPYVLKCVNAYCEAQPSVSGGNDDECATAWNKRALLVEQARTEPHKAEDAPSDAAAVDVAGLMAMADRFAKKEAEWAHGKESAIARAALESALRLALAAREGFVMVPVEPTPEMLEAGAGTKYEKRARNVWRDMIAAAAPKGTT